MFVAPPTTTSIFVKQLLKKICAARVATKYLALPSHGLVQCYSFHKNFFFSFGMSLFCLFFLYAYINILFSAPIHSFTTLHRTSVCFLHAKLFCFC